MIQFEVESSVQVLLVLARGSRLPGPWPRKNFRPSVLPRTRAVSAVPVPLPPKQIRNTAHQPASTENGKHTHAQHYRPDQHGSGGTGTSLALGKQLLHAHTGMMPVLSSHFRLRPGCPNQLRGFRDFGGYFFSSSALTSFMLPSALTHSFRSGKSILQFSHFLFS